MESKRHILSTVMLPHSLVELTKQNGAELDMLPFIEIKFINDRATETTVTELLRQRSTVVFTSTNAVDAVARYIGNATPDWNIYCIKNATAMHTGKHFNEANIKGKADDAKELAELIICDNVSEVIFFCGNKRMDTLPDHLGAAGVKVKEVIVYTTEETPHQVLRYYDAILFFSPSGVQSFFSANNIPANTTLFAIGNTTAQAIKEYTTNQIIVSATPSKENVVAIALQHFEQAIASA